MKKTGEGRSTVHGVVFDIFVPKRFPAKWTPVRVKKTRQNKIQSPVPIQSERGSVQKADTDKIAPNQGDRG
jgi:hypothetical protein